MFWITKETIVNVNPTTQLIEHGEAYSESYICGLVVLEGTLRTTKGER